MSNLYEMKEQIIDKGFEVFSPYKSKCSQCKHFLFAKLTCSAFPDGIPEKFLSGEKVHIKLEIGQSGSEIFTN